MGVHSSRVALIVAVVYLTAIPVVSAQRRPARPSPPARPPVSTAAAIQPPAPTAVEGVPAEALLGAPVYPNAVYLTAFDAGRGQTYYIFGARATFDEMVEYYEIVLDEDGDRVFTAPPVHQFQTGRFREESMAFPPSVTIKDYTWNGSAGYVNPTSPTDDRFPTIIQIVPTPLGQTER